jgi:hypothetical protein
MRTTSCPRTVLPLALLALALAAPRGALAATPSDIAEERTRSRLLEQTPGQDAPLSLTAELGTALTNGNTETFHIHTNLKLVWVPGRRWVSTTMGRALYEESLGVKAASSWAVAERVDRFVSQRVSLFAAAGVDSDVFAGIDHRESAQLGVSFLVVETRDAARDDLVTNRLDLEVGGYGALENRVAPPNAAPDTVVEDPNIEIAASRLAAAYRHAFQKGSEVGLDIEYIEDFIEVGNRVIGTGAYAAAALFDGLSVKLSVNYRYDNVPATPDLEKGDLLLTSGIVVSL